MFSRVRREMELSLSFSLSLSLSLSFDFDKFVRKVSNLAQISVAKFKLIWVIVVLISAPDYLIS